MGDFLIPLQPFHHSPGLELNGMMGMDVVDVPPPLPLKGNMADYGNLMENQDLIVSPTSPPPPPPQRVSGI